MNVKTIIESLNSKAKGILADPERLSSLIQKVKEKLEKNSNVSLNKVADDCKTGLNLLKAYATNQYNQVPWKSLVSLVAAFVYFLNPFDIIPDFIPIKGLIDDVTVLLFVFNSIKIDLEKFKSNSSKQPSEQTQD